MKNNVYQYTGNNFYTTAFHCKLENKEYFVKLADIKLSHKYHPVVIQVYSPYRIALLPIACIVNDNILEKIMYHEYYKLYLRVFMCSVLL